MLPTTSKHHHSCAPTIDRLTLFNMLELSYINGGSPSSSYLWSDGSTNQVYQFTTAGTYSVTIDQ